MQLPLLPVACFPMSSSVALLWRAVDMRLFGLCTIVWTYFLSLYTCPSLAAWRANA